MSGFGERAIAELASTQRGLGCLAGGDVALNGEEADHVAFRQNWIGRDFDLDQGAGLRAVQEFRPHHFTIGQPSPEGRVLLWWRDAAPQNTRRGSTNDLGG